MKRFLLLMPSLAGALLAQGEMVDLGGWRSQDGDDPRWASPDFDDSSWPPSPLPVSESGLTIEGAPATWYRATFHVPTWWEGRDLAIGIWRLHDGYEVFANGVKIGQHGTPERVHSFRPLAFVIPRALASEGTVQLAVRRWRFSAANRLEGFDISSVRPFPPAIGLALPVLQQQRILWYEVFVRGVPGLIAWLLTLACGAFCLRLWARGQGRELLWAGLATSLSGLYFAQAWPMFLTDAFPRNSLPVMAVTIVTGAGAHLFHGWFLAETLPGWRRRLRWASLAVTLGLSTLWLGFFGIASRSGWFAAGRAASAAAGVTIGFLVAWRVWRAGAPLLAAPVLAVTLRFGAHLLGTINNSFNYWTIGLVQVSFRRTSDAVMALALALLLYARAKRKQAAQRALEQDLAAAGRLQAMLLDAGETATPGFTVETAYLPSREVGGDFYQILPGEDGSLLALVGDVSGKGLEAAVLVSVVVGILGAVRTQSPGAVLAALNGGIAGRAKGRFITCCCARFKPDGQMILASAGHPAPYGDGGELEVEAGLPLGIVAGASYPEVTRAAPGSFTLVSDGVVEAANTKGELFGFDRTREISTKSAQEIADAAKAWGQNDDITVVTVRRPR